MSKFIQQLLETVIREEESLNGRYAELSKYLEHPLLKQKFNDYQKQGWNRISELHNVKKSMQDPKP